MADALKPCPCCGHKAELRNHMPTTWPMIAVQCGSDKCLLMVAGYTSEEAIAAWNRRAPQPEPTDAEVEALARAIAKQTGNDPDDFAADAVTVGMAWEPFARAALAAFVAGRNGGGS